MSTKSPGRTENGLQRGLSALLNMVLGVERGAARMRLVLVCGGLFVAWPLLALSLHPRQMYASPVETAGAILRAFIAPDTLLYLLALLAPFFVAKEWAATYLADIFEFDNNRVTHRYLWRAALGVLNPKDEVVHIYGKGVDKDDKTYADSTLIKIGGPGQVVVHLDCVAVFEGVDGSPRILGPSNAKQRINGFERLRAVISLRDHTETFDVSARTRDGIRLTAKDVRVVFSVARSEAWNPAEWETEEKLPRQWDYDRDAILALVYKQKKRPWHRQMVEGSARSALRNFIARHTFQELVSNILPTDDENAQTAPFVFREEILAVFQEEYRKKLRKSGLQLHWIGVGTWDASLHSLDEWHLKLWKDSLAKQKQARAGALEKLRFNTRLDTFLRLTQRILIAGALPPDTAAKEARVRRILFEVRQRIRQAGVWLSRQEKEQGSPAEPLADRFVVGSGEQTVPARRILGAVFRHLDTLATGGGGGKSPPRTKPGTKPSGSQPSPGGIPRQPSL